MTPRDEQAREKATMEQRLLSAFLSAGKCRLAANGGKVERAARRRHALNRMASASRRRNR